MLECSLSTINFEVSAGTFSLSYKYSAHMFMFSNYWAKLKLLTQTFLLQFLLSVQKNLEERTEEYIQYIALILMIWNNYFNVALFATQAKYIFSSNFDSERFRFDDSGL